jgi:RNA polymerase sigma-70 factor (ECF subfamily)
MDPRADAPGGNVDQGDPAQRVVDRHVVEAALAGLSDDFRVPLVLAEYGALEYAEIAEALEIPVGTVRSRIARARRQLGFYGESLR